MTRLLVLPVLSLGALGDTALHASVEIPPHPDALVYPELEFRVPDAADRRRELPGGVPVYVAPAHELPLVTVSLLFKGGSYLEPAEVVGAADALGAILRQGGTMALAPKALDDRLDELAADITISVGRETSSATLDCLASNFDEAFALLMDMLRTPAFDAERLRLHKDEVRERLARRNDEPFSVLRLELGPILYGPDHPAGRRPTGATIDAIDVEALESLRARIFHPGNLVVSATGDFREGALISALATALDGWTAGEVAPDPVGSDDAFEPKLFHARTAQAELPQGTVVVAGPCLVRDDPDAIAVEIMNRILGVGFTSRIMRRVRSNEGLAYAAMSQVEPLVHYPGPFVAFTQSKNETVALATTLILAEIERMRGEPVSPEELEVAKQAVIDAFPQRFASPAAVLATFASDELTGRPSDHWASYCARVDAITAEDVRRVASERLNTEELAILIIGNWDAIAPGDPEGRARMSDIRGGDAVHLPLRDPVTLR